MKQRHEWLNQVSAELGGQYADVVAAGDVALYGGLAALASFDRAELKRSIVESTAFRELLELNPDVRPPLCIVTPAFHPRVLHESGQTAWLHWKGTDRQVASQHLLDGPAAVDRMEWAHSLCLIWKLAVTAPGARGGVRLLRLALRLVPGAPAAPVPAAAPGHAPGAAPGRPARRCARILVSHGIKKALITLRCSAHGDAVTLCGRCAARR